MGVIDFNRTTSLVVRTELEKQWECRGDRSADVYDYVLFVTDAIMVKTIRQGSTKSGTAHDGAYKPHCGGKLGISAAVNNVLSVWMSIANETSRKQRRREEIKGEKKRAPS